ncbi:hypothetical protein F5Y14DRAFT_430496 [Nemania sp. NC0429]|nr:hypothetical protein F5Y14DRAFT_430496 [Nemania sp. NC0429]
MAPFTMKTLALPALLLAGMAQALPSLKPRVEPGCAIKTEFPAGATYKPGDKITIEWSTEGLPDGNINLSVQSQLVTPVIIGYKYPWMKPPVPIYDFKGGDIFFDPIPLENKKFEWTVEVVGDAKGDEYRYFVDGWYYTGYYSDGNTSDSCFTNDFKVSA